MRRYGHEATQNGGIHFHLVVVCKDDVRGNIDFNACFPSKGVSGKPVFKPDYATGNGAIKREWAYWRRTSKLYGFGWHQLQPMRENGEALGRYLGEYLRNDWDSRLSEDKGARCVRYFVHWSKELHKKDERKATPPHKVRFGWLTPGASVWREMVKQIVIVLNHNGAKIKKHNIKDVIEQRWAWKMAKLFPAVAFIDGDWQTNPVQGEIAKHNADVRFDWWQAVATRRGTAGGT